MGVLYGPHGEEYNTYSAPLNSNTGRWPLGYRLQMHDGRVFRFCLNGGVAMVAGKLYQAIAPVANHTNQNADVARAVGATAVSATLGATAASQDIYGEGVVHANNTGNPGYYYLIARPFFKGDAHATAALSTVLTVNLQKGYSVQKAIAVNDKLTFSRHPLHSVIVMPGAASAPVVGVPMVATAISKYCWVQTWGPAVVLGAGTLVAGNPVMPAAAVAGAVAPLAATDITSEVGWVIKANADTEYSLVSLMIAP